MNLEIQKIFDLRNYLNLYILHVGLQFGIFELLKEEPLDSDKIAQFLKADKEAMQVFLDALVAIKFLKKRSGKYFNVGIANKYLIPSSPFYIGDIVRFRASRWNDWNRLYLCIKKGMLGVPISKNPEGQKDFILAMHNLAIFDAPVLANKLSLSWAEKLIDIGGGPGTFSIYFAKRNPKLNCYILDLPPVLKFTRRVIRSYELSHRVKVIEGDYNREIPGNYDVAFLSKINSRESEKSNKRLIKRIFGCLNSKGEIILRCNLLDKEKTYPVENAIFSLYMALHQRDARCYSLTEVKDWFREAGFSKIRKLKINLWDKTSLVIADKIINQSPF